MAINTQTYSLFPVRRDGEISGSSTIGGGGSSVGSTSTATNTSALNSILSGQTAAIGEETTNRISGDVVLHNEITGETASRISADATERAERIYEDNRRLPLSGGTMTGDVYYTTNSDISSQTYVSGYAGSGFKLDNSTENLLEVDNLKVRNKFSAYELEINEISSIGGSLLVSAANGIPYLVDGTRFYFDEDGGANNIQFVVNDFVKAQIWTGSGTGIYLGQVTAVNHSATYGSAYIDCTTVSGTPWSKMKLVQCGSSSDNSRQSVIYITSSDTTTPYIDFCSGVVAGSLSGKQRLRIGNLSGITGASFGGGLSGYGLYGDNVYLKGALVITAGSGYGNLSDKPTSLAGINSTEASKLTGIEAGATVGATSAQVTAINNAATTANWGSISSVPAYLGAPGSAGLYVGSAYLGYYDGSAWKSYIDNSGNCKFVGVAEIGTGTVYYGQGNWNCAIKGADIYENAGLNYSVLHLNRVGYGGGTGYYRDLIIGNGKGATALFVSSANNTIYMGDHGGGNLWNLNVSGNITADDYIMSSDVRLKQNIKPITLQPLDIEYKEFEFKNKPNEKRFGVIAQELQKTNPELVHTDKDGMLSVSYIDLLIHEVAYLKNEINELKKKVK
jgi:hypothetical protein